MTVFTDESEDDDLDLHAHACPACRLAYWCDDQSCREETHDTCIGCDPMSNQLPEPE